MSARVVKHVVTGHDKDGRALIVSEQAPPETVLGAAVSARFLWGDDAIPKFPNAGAVPTPAEIAPPPGGSRFATLTIAAGGDADYHAFIAAAMGPYAEKDALGYHTTPTLDFIYVLSGDIALDVGETDSTALTTGDSVVLNGVRHRWRNIGAQAATILAVQIGAHDSRLRENGEQGQT